MHLNSKGVIGLRKTRSGVKKTRQGSKNKVRGQKNRFPTSSLYICPKILLKTVAQLHSPCSMSISGGPDGADAKQLSAVLKRGCGRFLGRMHLRGNSKCSCLGKRILMYRFHRCIIFI